MTNYTDFKKDELVSMLKARDEESNVRKGTPAYKLIAKNKEYSGPLGKVYFNNGIAHVPVDLEDEERLKKEIEKARKDKNQKLLNQLEEELLTTGTYIATSLANDFGIELEKINFEKETIQ